MIKVLVTQSIKRASEKPEINFPKDPHADFAPLSRSTSLFVEICCSERPLDIAVQSTSIHHRIVPEFFRVITATTWSARESRRLLRACGGKRIKTFIYLHI